MTAIVLTLISVPSAQASGAADTQLPGHVTAKVAPETAAVSERADIRLGESVTAGLVDAARVASMPKRPRSETCRSARVGTAWYRQRQRDWLKLRGVSAPLQRGSHPPGASPRKPRSCPDARYLAQVAKRRSFAARQAYGRWLERRTLRDFAFAPGADAWPKAVREVQRVFPGTEGWLLSCSAAEGGHGRWVGYGGQGYSAWLRDSDTVGGPLQFRYSTFTGMFRRAVDHVYAHGFRAPIFTSYTTAWRSALGQALAGGWARYTGNDNAHWSASWGTGCR